MNFQSQFHKALLLNILKAIYNDEEIGQFLGFKGGTALLIFYELNRFSVDLDFDLLDANKKELIFKKMEQLLGCHGILRNSEQKRFSLFFLLSYHNKIHNAPNIKIEINCRDFNSVYEQKLYMGTPIKIMVKQDMAAHKLVAMYERMGKANRDIYDVWFMLSASWPVNQAIITNRTGMTYADFLQVCINKLGKLDHASLLAGLGELLTPEQRKWVREKLLLETIFWLKEYLTLK